MEQGKEGMEKNLDGQNEVMQYLLGTLDDPPKMRQIEERLMVDDNFGDELSVAEDELIEKYLDGELTQAEQEQFESFFMAPPERKQQLRFSKNLRKFASAAGPRAAAAATGKRGFDWRQYFSFPVVRFAAVLLVVIGLGYGVWRVGFYRSESETNLAELNLAYQGGNRPLTARIVGFDYADRPSATRGTGDANENEKHKREAAAAVLAKAVKDNRNAETLYGSGKALLAKKELEPAIAVFEEAAGLAPQNANIQSDLGAAYLEMGKNASKEDITRGLDLLDKSLKHLQKAIELNPKLLEPRFNLAVYFEARSDPEKEKKAWNDYIAVDPSSKWTAEARARIKELDEKP